MVSNKKKIIEEWSKLRKRKKYFAGSDVRLKKGLTKPLGWVKKKDEASKNEKNGNNGKDKKKEEEKKENGKNGKVEVEKKLENEEEKFVFKEEPLEEERPKIKEITGGLGLEEEIVGETTNRRDEEEVREVSLSNDYNERLRRNEEARNRGVGVGAVDEIDKPNVTYDLNKIDSPGKIFYETGGREKRTKDIYSAQEVGEKLSGGKFVHEPSDLEKKSEETSMGGFGIAATRRKGQGDEKNPYDEIGRA